MNRILGLARQKFFSENGESASAKQLTYQKSLNFWILSLFCIIQSSFLKKKGGVDKADLIYTILMIILRGKTRFIFYVLKQFN